MSQGIFPKVMEMKYWPTYVYRFRDNHLSDVANEAEDTLRWVDTLDGLPVF